MTNTDCPQKYYCFYVDHTFFDARKIGETYTVIKQNIIQDQNSLIIATCQRIEVYTTHETNPLGHTDLPFKSISGVDNVSKRLISICSGVESQILGEKNIYHQVNKVYGSTNDDHDFKQIFFKALAEGKRIRQVEEFQAEADYEHIALEVLQSSLPAGGDKNLDLVVIGSGMLARNFVEVASEATYRNIFFITR